MPAYTTPDKTALTRSMPTKITLMYALPDEVSGRDGRPVIILKDLPCSPAEMTRLHHALGLDPNIFICYIYKIYTGWSYITGTGTGTGAGRVDPNINVLTSFFFRIFFLELFFGNGCLLRGPTE